MSDQSEEIVTVTRVIQYIGTREWVERTVAHSIHGRRIVGKQSENIIQGTTLGEFPESLGIASLNHEVEK